MSRCHVVYLQVFLVLVGLGSVGRAGTIQSASVLRESGDPVYLDRVTGSLWRGPIGNGLTGMEVADLHPGYRLPTRSEVTAFFDHFGFPSLPETVDAKVHVDNTQIAGLFRAMTGDGHNVYGTYFDGEMIGRAGISGGSNWLTVTAPTIPLDQVIDFEGHWLVKPVPEPSGLMLVGIGLLCALRCRR